MGIVQLYLFHCTCIMGIMGSFEYHFIQPRIIWEESLNKGLFRSGWPGGSLWEVILMKLRWENWPNIGGIILYVGILNCLRKDKVSWAQAHIIHSALFPIMDVIYPTLENSCYCDYLTIINCNQDLWPKLNSFSPKLLFSRYFITEAINAIKTKYKKPLW